MITNRQNPDQVTGNISNPTIKFPNHFEKWLCLVFADRSIMSLWNVFILQVENRSSKVSSMFSMMSFSTFSFLNVTITNAFTGNSNTLSPTTNNRWTFLIITHRPRLKVQWLDFFDPSKYLEPLFVFKIVLFDLSF